MNNFI